MNENKKIVALSDAEQLMLHQLNTSDYWFNKNYDTSGSDDESHSETNIPTLPNQWNFSKNLQLHKWQSDCIATWISSGFRGIAKVVTGAGKTIFALALTQEMQNSHNPDLKVLIVVPTIVLLNQWYDVVLEHGNIPAQYIGRSGGGHNDDINSDCVIFIAVNNSAVRKIVPALKSKKNSDLMLVVDECHRVRGDVMQQILSIKRKYSLGLSATPEREGVVVKDNEEDDDETSESESESGSEIETEEDIVVKELGDVIFELGYDSAIEQGFLPEFAVHHVGLPLTSAEKAEYIKVSNKITDIRKRLQEIPGSPAGGALSGWARNRMKSARSSDSLRAICSAYVSSIANRKNMLYHAESRIDGLLRLIKMRLFEKPNAQIILFHERIAEVMNIYELLRKSNIRAVVEHSQLSESIRANSIELFRKGIANVIVSGKALIEGFDAPAADIGVNVAASASKRQAIQATGRILRKGKDSLEEKFGLIYRFYIIDTTDEAIYKKIDFDKAVGVSRNRYFIWDPADDKACLEDIERNGPPYRPAPMETEIDWSAIKPGSDLEIQYEGDEYQFDEKTGNVYQKQGRTKKYVSNPQNVIKMIKNACGVDVRWFTITATSNRVFVRYCDNEQEWRTKYIGQLAKCFNFGRDYNVNCDVSALNVGDVYNGANNNLIKYKIISFRGQKMLQNENKRNSIPSPQVDSIIKNIDSRMEWSTIYDIYEVVGEDIVVCRINGQLHLVAHLNEPIRFHT